MKRRDFLAVGALATAACALPAWARDKRHIGVQLWSVRSDLERDFEGTLAALADFGYRQIELFGYGNTGWLGHSAARWHKLLKKNKLKAVSAHYMLPEDEVMGNVLTDGVKRAVDAHKSMGCKYLIMPWLPDNLRTADYTKKLCKAMNRTGEYCTSQGIQFGYHNHDFEFDRLPDGGSMYDLILERADAALVCLELDLYWAAFAGVDPVDLFKKAPGRFKLLHVKDMGPDRNTIEVGAGSIDFQRIFDQQQLAGTERFIVELEHYRTTPTQGVGEAYQAIKKLRFK